MIIIDEFNELSSLGWILGCRTIGFILGAVFSGVFTDHFRPQKILLSSAITRFLALALLTLLLHNNYLILPCFMVLIIGCGEGFFRSSYLAFIAVTVAEKDRTDANAISTLSMRLALTVSPLLATIIYSIANGYFALWLATFVLLTSCLLIAKLNTSTTSNAEKFTPKLFLKGYKEGFDEAIKHKWFIGGLAALALWLALSYSVQQIMLPLVSKTNYDSNILIGVALGCYSLGSILSSLLSER